MQKIMLIIYSLFVFDGTIKVFIVTSMAYYV